MLQINYLFQTKMRLRLFVFIWIGKVLMIRLTVCWYKWKLLKYQGVENFTLVARMQNSSSIRKTSRNMPESLHFLVPSHKQVFDGSKQWYQKAINDGSSMF